MAELARTKPAKLGHEKLSDPMKVLGQNFVKYFVYFGGNGISRKIGFEIY